jgi:pimeloyl-ACP methyl ester carboxylesterase
MERINKSLWIILAIVLVTILILPVLLNKESEILNQESRKEAPGQFITLSGGITHFEAFGPDTAQTVLLVHGLSVPFYMWDPTFKFLKENGFHVVRYDIFGRGYSDRPNAVYNGNLFTQQIADLLDALEIDKPIDVIAVSLGGPIVAEFTNHYPDKVRKVILIDPVHEPLGKPILKIPVLGNLIIDLYFARSQAGDFYKPEDHADWTEKFKPQMKYKGFKKAILSTLNHFAHEDKLPVYTAFGKLNKKVLLIWGEHDKTTPYEGNEQIRDVVECEFMSVKESGHVPHLEHPELVNSRIIHFLNE